MKLNKQQTIAAHYSGSKDHLLVLAGAGTGKTRTIIGRAIFLLKNKTPAKSIVLLTFTRRAAAEMTHRLELEVGDLAQGIFAGTFHRFCLDIIKTIPKTFGVENFTILDPDDQASLIKLIRGTVLRDGEKKTFPQARKIIDLYSYARNSCKAPIDHLNKHTDYDKQIIDKLIMVFSLYEERKKLRNYIDFDDILFTFLTTLRNNEKVRNKLRSLFSNILVDEMQDTNPLQWGILELLANPAKLFCVGDDAQSIYAFRGADFKNVHSFKKRMPNSEVIKLELNYRSTQETLDLANWLLKGSPLKYGKKLVAHKGKGNIPQLLDFPNSLDEAQWYGNTIQSWHSAGTKYSDIMILVRSAYISRHIEAVFVEKKIPYSFIGGTSLMKSAHVRDVFSLLRSAINFTDEIAWIRYLKLWPKIGDITAARAVERLISVSNPIDSITVLKQDFGSQPKIHQAIMRVQESIHQPRKAIEMALQFLVPLLKEKYNHWTSRNQDLELLEKLSTRYNNLSEFLETYTLEPIYNKDPENLVVDDAVTIITVHSAKGTEAPICMIPQASPGVYPHQRSIGNADEVEEERRVLYVALTRSKEELYITRAENPGQTVFFGGSGLSDSEKPSYFLTELPDKLIQHVFVDKQNRSGFLSDLKDIDDVF